MKILILLLAISIISCQQQAQVTSRVVKKSSSTVSNSSINQLVNEFAFKLAKSQNSDFFLSPVGIYSALYLVANGAEKETLTEFSQLLFGDSSLSSKDHLTSYSKLIKELGDSSLLEYHTALWTQQNFSINPQYINDAVTFFNTPIREVDFANSATRDIINKDVELKTHNKIKELLPLNSINSLTRLVIINTLYFLADWASPFKERFTRPQNFFDYAGNAKKVPFMRQKLTVPFFSNQQLTYLSLPYQDNRYSMQIILPNKGQEKDFFKNLSLNSFNHIKERSQKKKITLLFPKFKKENFLNLKPLLQSLGLKRVFSDKDSQLGKISSKSELFVTDAFHKTFLKVDEKGTEATAATAIVVGLKSMPRPQQIVKVDHPFLFTIFDHKTNIILFMGTHSFEDK